MPDKVAAYGRATAECECNQGPSNCDLHAALAADPVWQFISIIIIKSFPLVFLRLVAAVSDLR